MARDGEAQALSDLLKNVPDQKRKRMLNKAMEDDGGTPLHLAARHNHYEVCKLLIKYGASKRLLKLFGQSKFFFKDVSLECVSHDIFLKLEIFLGKKFFIELFRPLETNP